MGQIYIIFLFFWNK